MRKLVALATSTFLLPGCLTTNYVLRDRDGVDVRFGGRQAGETLVRHVVKEERRSHFLFGAVPYEADVDVAELAELRAGETLVDTRLDSAMSGLDIALWLGIGVISGGLGCLVWTPRTTTITGDVVTWTAGKPEAKAGPATKPAEVEAKEPAPESGHFVVLDGSYTLKAAEAACRKHEARLARKPELEAAFKDKLLDQRAGDVWTADRKGQDGWSFNTESGAPFLKDPGETLGAVCFKKGS